MIDPEHILKARLCKVQLSKKLKQVFTFNEA